MPIVRMHAHWRNVGLLVVALFALNLAYPVMGLRASFGLNDPWGHIYGMRDGVYGGVENSRTTPDPVITSGWGANPTGLQVSNYSNSTYIESGALKDCDAACLPHFYASWTTDWGENGFYEDTTATLAPGGWYFYKIQYQGSLRWAVFYATSAGTQNPVSPDMRTSSAFAVMGAGGEASCQHDCQTGFSRQTYNTYWDENRASHRWCYDYVKKNYYYGSITACGGDNNWDTNAP